MFHIAVCDDDASFANTLLSRLKKALLRLPDGVECDAFAFSSADQVLSHIMNEPLHLLFLDIDMPQKTGFELAEELSRINPEMIIIFVSAFDNLVYDSFRFSPFGFLRKTHLATELEKTLERAIDSLLSHNKTRLFSSIFGDINLRLIDILYIESEKNYYTVHCIGKASYKCRGTLTSAEQTLSDLSFCRIHHAFLINLENVRLVTTNRRLILTDGTEFSVSARRWSEFHRAYMEFSRKKVVIV